MNIFPPDNIRYVFTKYQEDRMKKRVLLILIMICAGTCAGLSAEEAGTTVTGGLSLPAGFAFGVDLADRAGHLAWGVDVTSPYFFWERVAVRLRGELLFDNREWNTFFMTKAGLVGVGGKVGKNIRLYGEGGILLVFPHSDFSSEDFVFGGYGHFGMDFF
jgi:hypothetical protein